LLFNVTATKKGKGKSKAIPQADVLDMDVGQERDSEDLGLESPTADELAFMAEM
jgi:hypothetical protein